MLNHHYLWVVATVAAVSSICGATGDTIPAVAMDSPDQNVLLQVRGADSHLVLDAKFHDEWVLSDARLEMPAVNGKTEPFRILRTDTDSVDERWTSVIGKNREVRNHYHAYTLHGRVGGTAGLIVQLQFRCYNDGFAFRYVIPAREGGEPVMWPKISATLRMPEDFTFWSYNGERHNVGPMRRAQEAVPAIIRPPMVIRTPAHRYMAILESGVLRREPFVLAAPSEDLSLQLTAAYPALPLPFESSWRTFILGRRAGDLLESNLAANLNEPCKIEDPSWIKPGRTLWDWRVWGYEAADGFRYELDTRSHLRLIDFAAAHQIDYLLIDADWYGAEFSRDSDPTSASAKVDIEACMRYAGERGIGVFLYLNDVGARQFGLERVLKQFADWGAVGVKYGFMRGTWQEKALHTRHVVERCANYGLMVNFHDNPIPPSGDERTWPNLVTREFGHSQADAKRSYFPETAVTAPYVNMLAGPVDYCDGWFALHSAYGSRERVFQDIPGTVAAEVAKLIVIYSGFSVLPDAPEEYLKKSDVFECIRKMPSRFDSYHVLAGEIGESICVARQAGENWFVGTLTNRDARDIEVKLDFLPAGSRYRATFYEDAELSHFRHNREAYSIRTKTVQAGDRVAIRLAPGGGNAVHLERMHGDGGGT